MLQVDIFNRPWMENLHPNLLYRYWKKKQTGQALYLKTSYGVKICCQITPFGELRTLIHEDYGKDPQS